jgi:hypothetical protein
MQTDGPGASRAHEEGQDIEISQLPKGNEIEIKMQKTEGPVVESHLSSVCATAS